jgi:hypothetical protein
MTSYALVGIPLVVPSVVVMALIIVVGSVCSMPWTIGSSFVVVSVVVVVAVTLVFVRAGGLPSGRRFPSSIVDLWFFFWGGFPG